MRYALKGTLVWAPECGKLTFMENGYIVVENGITGGVFETLPAEYDGIEVRDYGDRLIMPAFCDMHLHAPQYPMLGLGMDMELIDWLNTYTFRTEAHFADTELARRIYHSLAADLVSKGTTRVCIFSTLHRESTHVLMEELERAGISGYAGKVNMDRNSTPDLHETAKESVRETERWIDECARYRHIKPIITPRFTPSCTDGLMKELGRIAKERDLPVQSHLSENTTELEWVKELCPDCERYWDTYARYGLWNDRTVMAHCVHSDEVERKAILDAGVTVAHCPDSNTNIASGIAPVRRMLTEGIKVTLGSDIAGGCLLYMPHTAMAAVRASKLRWFYCGRDERDAFLTVAEAFYMMTTAPAAYFGSAPGFPAGEPLHALVFDETGLPPAVRELTNIERFERLMYLASENSIMDMYWPGRREQAND